MVSQKYAIKSMLFTDFIRVVFIFFNGGWLEEKYRWGAIGVER